MGEKEGKKGKGLKILAVILFSAIFIAVLLIYLFYFRSAPVTSESWQQIDLTQDNLPSYLSQFNAVKDLPKSGVIALTVGESEYTIKKGTVEKGKPETYDIAIAFPEEYFEIIGKNGWCASLNIAKSRGDVSIRAEGSTTALALKYRALAKYQSCLG